MYFGSSIASPLLRGGLLLLLGHRWRCIATPIRLKFVDKRARIKRRHTTTLLVLKFNVHVGRVLEFGGRDQALALADAKFVALVGLLGHSVVVATADAAALLLLQGDRVVRVVVALIDKHYNNY